jgi:DNA-directed RNA polymerase subunit E'/Rpb7
MFGIHMITDIIKLPASDLSYQACKTDTKNDPSWLSMVPILHREIDKIYPNRVLTNVGLLISRYYHSQKQQIGQEMADSSMDYNIGNVAPKEEGCPPPLKKRRTLHRKTSRQSRKYGPTTQFVQTGGACDGSSVHYTVTFPMIVFRPYIGEILVGTILDADATGIIVSMGFLASIFVPAIYMLQPSTFSASSSTRGVWVWTPTYDDEDDDKDEPFRYEMNIGAEIRVRVKSIHYPPVASIAKGEPVAASNSATDAASSSANHQTLNHKESSIQSTQRQRSSSVNAINESVKPVTSFAQPNTAMYIVASICEDGLGLTSWWSNEVGEGEDQDDIPD